MGNVKQAIAVAGLGCVFLLASASSGISAFWPNTSNLGKPASDTFTVYIINQDQFEGSWKQFKGELKKEWGEFTDDDLLQIEGKMDKFEGKMQERYGDRKEELREWTERWFERHTFESQSGARNR